MVHASLVPRPHPPKGETVWWTSTTKGPPSRCKLMLALAPKGPFFAFDPSKVPERTAKRTGSRFHDGEGCFKDLLWAMGERQKVSTSSLQIWVAMIALGWHGSLQQTLSQALNTTGLYNDYTFRSMLQAQEIRLRSPDRLSPRGVVWARD